MRGLPILIALAAQSAAAAQDKPAGPMRQRTMAEDLQMLTGVLQQIRVNHPDSIDSHDLIMAAIQGIVRAADPHSYVIVYQPLIAAKAAEMADGKMMPAPIAFRFVGGAPVVVGVAAGSKATTADILPGDELIAIEGEPVAAASADELEIVLAGKKGTPVRLTFERQRSDGSRATIERAVIREKVGEVTAVPAAFLLDPETGYVRVTTFVGLKVNEDLKAAVDKLSGQGMKRLVLDLRDNGGGSVKEAADAASMFLPQGAVVYQQEGKKPELNETVSVKRSFWNKEKRYPIVLLINGNTASASELVAGALQDHDRALIVGRTSFGKSLVMRIFPLPDGSLMWMVVGHAKTPCGRIIQRQYRGITVREYYRRAAAERDTVGRPSCRTDRGRTVYGGGGIYPDLVLAEHPDLPLWVERLREQLIPLKWVAGYLGANPNAMGSLDQVAKELAVPAPALADFRAFAAREGAAVPDGADPDRQVSRVLLPLLVDAKWGEAGLYRILALLDPDVSAAVAAFDKAATLLGPP